MAATRQAKIWPISNLQRNCLKNGALVQNKGSRVCIKYMHRCLYFDHHPQFSHYTKPLRFLIEAAACQQCNNRDR
jgi:hypothetical protein